MDSRQPDVKVLDLMARENDTDTEHSQITADFLNWHQWMLDILLSEEDKDLKAKERKQ